MSGAAKPAVPTLPPRARVSEGARVLVVVAHPALHRSRANRRMVRAIRELPGITVHDLYEAYPEFEIDVPHEKALLLAHETIVWQHPFYWYSTPAMMKEWFDLVLEFGWAYGPKGTALAGKRVLSAITTGGPETAYHREGYNRFTMRELLAPIEQTARLCQMEYLPPWISHGARAADATGLDGAAQQYRAVIEALRDGVPTSDWGDDRGLMRLDAGVGAP